MSKGQLSYEFSRAKTPTYHDGTPRKAWRELCQVAQWSWARDGRRGFNHV